jgi:uncharacterized C2H2 Zn-finger protein
MSVDEASSKSAELKNCPICKEVFASNFNLKRHIATKHNDFEEIHRCPVCYKIFTRKWSLVKHIEKCKGATNRFQCEYCMVEFKQDNSRFRHYKICSIKKELDVETCSTCCKVGQQIVNNSGQINNLTNSTQNNNNNIIIVYNPSGKTPFSTDHLTAEDLQKIIKLAASRLDNRTMEEYSKQIFSNEENRCIKKTNIKLGHSQVHTGENKWKLQLDKNIYPQLATDLANNMSEYVDKKREDFKKDMYIRLRDFVDSMCDAGYINPEPTSREKELQKEYKTFMNGLKLIVYGNTKNYTTL